MAKASECLTEILYQAKTGADYEERIAVAYSQASDDIKKKANEAEQLEAELSARLKEKDSEIGAINSQAATDILRKTNEVRQLESDLVTMLEEKEQEIYYVCRNARDEMLHNIRVDLLNRSRDISKVRSIVISRIKSFKFQIITEINRIKQEEEQIKAELEEKIKNINKEIKDIDTKAMADIERIVKEKERINSLQLEVVNLNAKIAEIKARQEEEIEADNSEEASFMASSPWPKDEPQEDVLSTIISEAVEDASSVIEEHLEKIIEEEEKTTPELEVDPFIEKINQLHKRLFELAGKSTEIYRSIVGVEYIVDINKPDGHETIGHFPAIPTPEIIKEAIENLLDIEAEVESITQELRAIYGQRPDLEEPIGEVARKADVIQREIKEYIEKLKQMRRNFMKLVTVDMRVDTAQKNPRLLNLLCYPRGKSDNSSRLKLDYFSKLASCKTV